MIKKTLLLIIATSALFACNTNQSGETATEKESSITEVTVAQLLSQPADFVSKEIKVEGTVNHVCKESGKRMFIFGEDPENAIKIEAGNDISQFQIELEGSKVQVEGTFKELIIDEAYLSQMEDELKTGNTPEALHEHNHDDDKEHAEEHADEELAKKMEYIKKMREKIAETKEGYIAQYWIVGKKFKEITE